MSPAGKASWAGGRARMWLLACVILVSCGDRDEPLRVLAAASLADVLPPVVQEWEASAGREVQLSFDGTSRLAAQLEAGAPADLFVAADTRWMDHLVARGLVRVDTRVDVVGNALVVVVPKERAGAALEGPKDLLDPGWARIGLAGENVPAGRYARQALGAAGVLEELESKVVAGDNVRAVLAWVARGEVDAGVVYATDAAAESEVSVAWTFPPGSHAPIVYPAALTADADPAAAALLAFFAGPGRTAFEQAGFTILDGGEHR